ncbi:MAG: transporter substrate-binding domain-containing protein [Promethearchaeota archaeon]
MKNKYYSFMILVLLFLPFLPISNVSAAPVADTSLADIIAAGKIVVGIEAGYPPFEQRNPDTDEIEGFDPDIMKIIADDIGVDIEWVDVDWAVIFTSLEGGSFDCVISAVTITATREESMDFSRWYFKSEQAVLVNTANPESIATIDDVNASTVNVGYQEGTTSELYLKDNNYTAVESGFTTITLAIQALELGTVDVVLGDHATLLSGMDADTMEVVDTFSPEDFGIPVQTGSDSLRLRINEVLDSILGTDLDNPVPTRAYNNIYKEWMEVDAVGYVATIPGFSLLPLIGIISIVSALLMRKIRK